MSAASETLRILTPEQKRFFEANGYLTEMGYALHRLFPHFLVPYRHRVEHEGTLRGYFVALSEKLNRSGIPRRDLVL